VDARPILEFCDPNLRIRSVATYANASDMAPRNGRSFAVGLGSAARQHPHRLRPSLALTGQTALDARLKPRMKSLSAGRPLDKAIHASMNAANPKLAIARPAACSRLRKTRLFTAIGSRCIEGLSGTFLGTERFKSVIDLCEFSGGLCCVCVCFGFVASLDIIR